MCDVIATPSTLISYHSVGRKRVERSASNHPFAERPALRELVGRRLCKAHVAGEKANWYLVRAPSRALMLRGFCATLRDCRKRPFSAARHIKIQGSACQRQNAAKGESSTKVGQVLVQNQKGSRLSSSFLRASERCYSFFAVFGILFDLSLVRDRP